MLQYINSYFGIIAGIIALYAFVPYMFAIKKGTATPVLATWLVFATVDVLSLVSLLNMENPTALFVPWGFAIGATLTFALALFKAEDKSLSILDKVCLGIAGIGIITFLMTGEGELGMYASLVAMSVGAVPTLVQTWNAPEKEDFQAWFLFGVSALFNLFYLGNWGSFNEAIFPIVIAGINVPLMLMVLKEKFFPRKKN